MREFSSDDLAFLCAIRERPCDDLPRLIYADFLDERGDPLGEFIRLQLQTKRGHTLVGAQGFYKQQLVRSRFPSCQPNPILERETGLIVKYYDQWVPRPLKGELWDDCWLYGGFPRFNCIARDGEQLASCESWVGCLEANYFVEVCLSVGSCSSIVALLRSPLAALMCDIWIKEGDAKVGRLIMEHPIAARLKGLMVGNESLIERSRT